MKINNKVLGFNLDDCEKIYFNGDIYFKIKDVAEAMGSLKKDILSISNHIITITDENKNDIKCISLHEIYSLMLSYDTPFEKFRNESVNILQEFHSDGIVIDSSWAGYFDRMREVGVVDDYFEDILDQKINHCDFNIIDFMDDDICDDGILNPSFNEGLDDILP